MKIGELVRFSPTFYECKNFTKEQAEEQGYKFGVVVEESQFPDVIRVLVHWPLRGWATWEVRTNLESVK